MSESVRAPGTACPAATGPLSPTETHYPPVGRPPPELGPLPGLAGSQIGKYQVVQEIGSGGMGRVYKAFDPELQRYVAVKVLRPDGGLDDINRFRGEAALVAALEHQNIVQVYDIGNDSEDRPYIVLEYVDGGSLGEQIRKRLPPPRQAAEMVETLACAVQAAHDKGIIHRDLKPANILVAKSGTLKVTDFGLGKRLEDTSGQTQPGEVFGTPQYMAPEQAAGDAKAVGPAADVYALGAILYECLTARPPFAGTKVWEILGQVQYADPIPPSVLAPRVPRDLCTIALKCLEKSTRKRYPSAGELAEDLRRYLDGMPIQAHPVPWLVRVWRRVRRRPVQSAVIALIVGGAVAVAALSWYAWEQRRELDHQAETQRLMDEHDTLVKAEETKHLLELEDRHNSSLGALGEIRDLVLDGDLTDPNRVKHLHKRLAAFYTNLINRDRDGRLAEPRRVAEDLVKLGRMLGRTGDKLAAAEVYGQAEELFRRAAPGDSALAAEAAAAGLAAGRLLGEVGHADQARSKAQQAEAALRELARSDPQNLGTIRILTEAHQLTGELAVRQADWAAAERAFTQAIESGARLAAGASPASPDRFDAAANLARGYGWRGDVYLYQGRAREADADYWQSHRLREEVVAGFAEPPGKAGEPSEKLNESQFQLARSWNNLSAYQLRAGAVSTAVHFLDKSIAERVELVKRRPLVHRYQADLADAWVLQVDLRMLTGELTPASREDLVRQVRQARAITDQLWSLIPGDVQVQSARAACRVQSAKLVADRPSEAEPEAAAAIAILGGAQSNLSAARPRDLFLLAAASALQAEFKSAPRAEAAAHVVALLREAVVNKRYLDRHPSVLSEDRAFRFVRNEPTFQKFIAEIGVPADRSPATSRP